MVRRVPEQTTATTKFGGPSTAQRTTEPFVASVGMTSWLGEGEQLA